MLSHLSHPEPKLLNLTEGKAKEYSYCDIRLPVRFLIGARFLLCSKVQNISLTAVSAVWKRCSPLLIPTAAASSCSSHSVLEPTRGAAKGITPTARHVGPDPDAPLGAQKILWLPVCSTGGSNVPANMAHSSCGKDPDKITKRANLFSRQTNQMFPALLS